MSDKFVTCGQHGMVRAAYACAHVVQSLRDGEPRGLFWSRDESGCFNGWCADCERRVVAAGGEWDDETEASADIRLLCENCFLHAMRMNGVEPE